MKSSFNGIRRKENNKTAHTKEMAYVCVDGEDGK